MPVTTNRDVDAIYTDEFSSLIGPYIADKHFLSEIIANLGEERVKEVVFNWTKIKPEIEKFRGTKID